MKLFAAAFALIISPIAFACPNLTGKFSCPDPTRKNGGSVITISQSEKEGVTSYIFAGNEMIADNQTRPYSDAGLKEGTRRVWCDGDFLKVNLIGKFYDIYGNYIGETDHVLQYSVLNDYLILIAKGHTTDPNGRNNHVSSELYCLKF